MQALSATASPSMVSCGHGGSCVGPLCSASLNDSYTTQERFLFLTVLGLQSEKNSRSWGKASETHLNVLPQSGSTRVGLSGADRPGHKASVVATSAMGWSD